MKKIVFTLVFIIFIVNIAYTHENEHVHPFTLTQYAVNLITDNKNSQSPYYELFQYFYDNNLNNDNGIADGSFREDRILQGTIPFTHWDKYNEVPIISMKCHFYNAWDGKGIDGNDSAIVYQNDSEIFNKAMVQYSMNKEYAYFELGRVCHLLQDMSSPSHVEGDNHFLPWIDNSGNNYEDWCKEHATEIESYIAGELSNLQVKTITNLDNAFKELAEETYRNVAISGTLNEDENNPANGDIAQMFASTSDNSLAYISYIKDDTINPTVKYWTIANIGDYIPNSLEKRNWWPVPAISGMNSNQQYYYIEQNHLGAIPVQVWDMNAGQWVGNSQRFSLAKLWSGICGQYRSTPAQTKELMPLTVEYTAGLLKYFYDTVKPPEIESSTPKEGATGVNCNIQQIILTFSKEMDPNSSFEIWLDSYRRLNTYTWSSGNKTLTIPVISNLASDHQYTLNLLGTLTDKNGILLADGQLHFTTSINNTSPVTILYPSFNMQEVTCNLPAGYSPSNSAIFLDGNLNAVCGATNHLVTDIDTAFMSNGSYPMQFVATDYNTGQTYIRDSILEVQNALPTGIINNSDLLYVPEGYTHTLNTGTYTYARGVIVEGTLKINGQVRLNTPKYSVQGITNIVSGWLRGLADTDTTPPNNPTQAAAVTSDSAELLKSDTWTNKTAMLYWNGSQESWPSYINGYYLYTGSDPNGVPNQFRSEKKMTLNNIGQRYVRIRVADSAGNISDPQTIFIYKYDRNLSVFGQTNPTQNEWVTTTLKPTCSIEVSDVESGINTDSAYYRYSTNNGATWSMWEKTFCSGANGTNAPVLITADAVPFNQESSYQNIIQYKIRDMAGNETVSQYIRVKIDIDPIKCVNFYPAPGAITSTTPTFTMFVTPKARVDAGTINVTIDNHKIESNYISYDNNTGTIVVNISLHAGSHTISIKVADIIGYEIAVEQNFQAANTIMEAIYFPNDHNWKMGENVSETINIGNQENIPGQVYAEVRTKYRIHLDNGEFAEQDAFNLISNIAVPFTWTNNYALPEYICYYWTEANIYSDDTKTNLLWSGKFYHSIDLQNPWLNLTNTEVPSPFIQGDNTFVFSFINSHDVLYHADITLNILDPDAQTIYNQQQIIDNLSLNETRDITFVVPIQDVKVYEETVSNAPTYKLQMAYNGWESVSHPLSTFATIKNTVTINTSQPVISEDKLKFTVTVVNSGDFKQENYELRVQDPDCAYSTSQTVTLLPKESRTIEYMIPIPNDLARGTYKHKVSYGLNNLAEREFDWYYLGPQVIQSPIENANIAPGGTGLIEISNIGGVGTVYNYNFSISKPGFNTTIGQGQVDIPYDAKRNVSFILPANLAQGWYCLKCQYNYNAPNDYPQEQLFNIYINSGLPQTKIDTNIQKWRYDPGENISINALATGVPEAAKVKVKIFKYNETKETFNNFDYENACAEIIADHDDVWLEVASYGMGYIYRYNINSASWEKTSMPVGGGLGNALSYDSLWLNTGVGLARYSKAELKYAQIYPGGSALYLEGDQYVWQANDGLIKIDLFTPNLQTTYPNSALGYIYSLRQDGDDLLVAGSGLYKFNTKTNQWTEISTTGGRDTKAVDNYIWYVGDGIMKIDKNTNQMEKYNTGGTYNSIIYDKPYLWFAGAGLQRYNTKTDEWKKYYDNGQLQSLAYQDAYGTTDGQGIWLSVYNKGVERIKTTGDLVYENTVDPTVTNLDLGTFANGEYVVNVELLNSLGQVIASSKDGFFVGPLDKVAPDTSINLSGNQYQSGTNSYINDQTQIYFVATDSGTEPSGIDFTEYAIDASTWTVYASSFTLAGEGEHTVEYRSRDKAGNLEDNKQAIYYLDITAPESQIVASGYEIAEGTTTYVNSHSTFTISAIDPMSNGVSSGIKQIQYQTDSGNYVIISSTNSSLVTPNLSIPDGQHTITYQAMDNVGNLEALRTLTSIFDSTKPQVKSTYPANNAKVKAEQATPITITFTEPVQSADWSKDIILQEANGQVIEDYTITYDSVTCTVSINSNLQSNTEYEVILKNTISDRVNNYLDACQFSFQTMMSAAEGGTVIDPATGLTLIIPPNALPVDGYFEIALVAQTNPPKLPKPLKWLNNGQKAYQIIFYNENSIIVQQPVKKFFQVLLALNQQWITTALETDPVEYKNIKIYQTGSVLDFVARMTQKATSANIEKSQHAPRLLSEQKYNAQDQELTIEMDSFGIFALAGFTAPDTSLDDLSCYPNPFNPCKQNITIQYYLLNESEVTIAIYDLLGNLVKTWEIPTGEMNARSGLNQLSWDGRNGQGDTVANGGYILFVHSDGQKKKFKILVIK
ncbi:MAG: Ig-like domain-containing protein [bacterium]|nr:Ig-like domain-containing protein [bacterium]